MYITINITFVKLSKYKIKNELRNPMRDSFGKKLLLKTESSLQTSNDLQVLNWNFRYTYC